MEDPIYFVSYVRTDSELALRLARDLRAAGVALWMDQLDLQVGERWDRSVEAALKGCKGMFALLSPESLASDNVMDEISFALEKGKQILPIVLSPCEIPFRLRRVQYVDLAADYDAGIRRLLQALRGWGAERAEEAAAHPVGNVGHVPGSAPLFVAPQLSPPAKAVKGRLPRSKIGVAAKPRRRGLAVLVGFSVGLAWGFVLGIVNISDLTSYHVASFFPVGSDRLASVGSSMGLSGLAGTLTGVFSLLRRREVVILLGSILAGCVLVLILEGKASESRRNISAILLGGSALGAMAGSIVVYLSRKLFPSPRS